MTRFLRLYFRLRWKLFAGALKQAKAKGAISQIGAILGVVAIGFLGVFLVFAAAAFVVMALSGGVALLGSEPGPRAGALATLRILFFFLLGVLLLMPALRAGRGSFGADSGGLTRLLLLPLSRRHLHASEVVANAMDPFILAIVPGLLMLGAVIASQVGLAGGLVAVVASLLMVLALMTWAALLGIALQLLFRDRKRAELAMMVALLLWIGLAVGPGVFESQLLRKKQIAREAASQQEGPEIPLAPPTPKPEPSKEELLRVRESERAARLALAERFPVWLQWLPSESFARTLAEVSRGRALSALPSLLALAAFGGACWGLSLRLWQRLISSPESSDTGANADVSKLRLRRLPGLSSESSGVAFATARGFLRTIRGKLALAMTPLMVLMLGFMLTAGKKLIPEAGFFSGTAQALGLLAIGMSLLNMLPVMANAFACDRAGFTLQALTPVSEKRLVWGKTWGAFLFYLPCLLLSLLAVQVFADPVSPLQFCESLLGGIAAFALAAPLGAWVSILFPKQADLGKIGQAGNPHQGAQALLMLGMGLSVGLSSVVSWLGFLVLGSAWGALLSSTIFALLSWLLAWPFLEGAAGGLQKRWEAVLLTAQGH